jgi:hypothetical protein
MQSFTPGIFVTNQRNIGGIVAQVTIQEQERDELTVTEHPVEQGAPIHDHAFKRASEITIKAGWSAAWAGDLSATGGGVYGKLLALQVSLRPFDLHTGKRVYPSMLIQSLSVTTDQHSEFALMADIACRQVIIVRTSTAKVATSSDPDNQKNPEKTAGQEQKGTQQTRNVGSGDARERQVQADTQERTGLGSGDVRERQGTGTLSSTTATTPEGVVVENKAAENIGPSVEFTADDKAVFPIPPAPQIRASTISRQQLLRKPTWQPILKYQHNLVRRLRSG